MAEFGVMFAVTCLILCGLACALYFGRAPVYQISREEALDIMQSLINGSLAEMKWLVFIGHAIPMDPDLNIIRLQCNEIESAAEKGLEIGYAASPKRYNKEGLEQIELVINNLQKLIADTPIVKEF
jgi:hypothetical protein